MRSLILILALACLTLAEKNKPTANVLELTKASPAQSGMYSFETDQFNNQFEVKLKDPQLITDTNFYLILESDSPDLEISVMDSSESEESRKSILDIMTYSGNAVLAMSDSFFNGKFNFFKETGSLKFQIINRSRIGNSQYRIRAEIGKFLNLDLGKIYTSRVDSILQELTVNLRYNGAKLNELEKLRFQVTSVRQKKDYSLTATVEHDENTYVLNTIFQKTVGGILATPNFRLCREESCQYTLHIKMSKVKTINIESFLIPKVEVLSIQHYEEYYDRVYANNKTTYYNLPYEDSMEEMDVTISLVPVTGTTGLYINAKTLPMDLENFDWKEKGPLAKRITIRWKELVQMRAEKSNLFIAVFSSRPGEYLIKIDAHDQGFRGRLSSGIIESGFVAYDEISQYFYYFEVFETQEITFDLKLNIISGDGDLYLKKCDANANCQMSENLASETNLLKSEGAQNQKSIAHTFKCEKKQDQTSAQCLFVIGIKGKENHGTHYEVSLQETNFHRLMTPGHSVPLSLNTDQTIYLKFSYPGRPKKANLFLSAEALWGSFDIILSRSETYPTSAEKNIVETFVSTKLGLYNSLKTIPIEPAKFGEEILQGIYYIAVKAKSSCSLNLRFFEKNDSEISIHSLTAGHQVRAEIHNSQETIYYTIKVSLETQQASSVSIVLTPLKGQYVMFANRNGKLPTDDNREYYSQNNHLELFYESNDTKANEYIIGIRLNPRQSFDPGSYQFMISMSYSNKPLKLNPGIISQHLLTKNNLFLIEVTQEMRTILILKSVVDGYNIELSATFSKDESDESAPATGTFRAEEKNVAIFLSENDLDANCKKLNSEGTRCFIHLKIVGNMNQKVSVGFTFNDHPFQLHKNLVITGPMLTNANAKINFIYHAEPGQQVGVYFNSKGRDVAFYTKLVRGDQFDEQSTMMFPTAVSHDTENHQKQGYITNVFYDEKKMGDFGSSPEILISIRSLGNAAEQFDPAHHFVLQVSMDAKEILRTQTLSENVQKDSWNYYTFYNNGNTESLRVYVSTPITTRLEVLLSRGLLSRPPFTNKPAFSKVAIGSIDISLTPNDLLSDRNLVQEKLKGHYTVAVRAGTDCNINIFWNNKEDLNYIELTPNTPTSMAIEAERPLYFSFYAKDVTNRLQIKGLISIYLKSTAEAQIYILKSAGELAAPSPSDYVWKGNVPKSGGVTLIQIRPDHPEYCTECLYIGSIVSSDNGQVSILANLRHDGQAIPLTPGFTFPDVVLPQERIVYKVFNPDANPLDFSISMLSGFVNFYVSSKSDISETKFDESYGLESTLNPHKFINVIPSKYGIKTAQDFYILLANPRKETASLTMSVDKNDIMSPIEPGITKYVHLSPGEQGDYMYTPKDSERVFEIRFEVRQVIDETKIDEVLSQIGQMLRVYHINVREDRYQIKPSHTSIMNNKVYVSLDISQNNKGTFAINLKNPTSSTVAYSLDLLNGGYKLLNFNEFNVDMIRKENELIYEGYGQKSKYLFVDLRVCHGDVNLEFFQDDYANIQNQNKTDFKKITDNNAAIHYIKMEHEKVFLKVTNKKEELSIYEISVFNEKDLDTNPYSELAQGNKGKVDVETETSTVRFIPVTIRQTFSKEFYHRVNYTVFLTDDFKVLRYLKGCGNQMIEHAFKNPHIITASKVFRFETIEDIKNATKKVDIKIPNLSLSTKYYGIVLAKVDMFPREPGYVTSVRSGKVFYDEFVFISARFNLPFNLVVAVLFCVALFALMFLVVKAYIFGQIGSMRFFDKLGSLANYDEALFGMNVSTILEEEYYSEPRETADGQHVAEHQGENTKDLEHDIHIDIEMSGSDNNSKTA